MIEVKEGLGCVCALQFERVTGAGAITVTSPERRIVDSNRALIGGYDWAAATWNASTAQLLYIFDSTLTGLTAVATYYVQLRGVANGVRRGGEIRVDVINWGP